MNKAHSVSHNSTNNSNSINSSSSVSGQRNGSLTSSANTATTTTSAAAGSNYTNLNRGATAPARILGSILKVYTESLKQAIGGIGPQFSTLTLPSELLTVFTELDNFIHTASASFSSSAWSLSPLIASLSNNNGCSGAAASNVRFESKSYDALVANNVLNGPLHEPFYRDCLHEVYELYDIMEITMKRETVTMTAAAEGRNQSISSSIGGAGYNLQALLNGGSAMTMTVNGTAGSRASTFFNSGGSKNTVSIHV